MIFIAHIRDNFANSFYPRWAEWWAAGLLMKGGCKIWPYPHPVKSPEPVDGGPQMRSPCHGEGAF
jgi:hypothetical protein